MHNKSFVLSHTLLTEENISLQSIWSQL